MKLGVEVTGDHTEMQRTLGRRVSRSGALHLVEGRNSTQQDWMTLCGRRISFTTVLISEEFESGQGCCNVCIIMSNRKKPIISYN